MMDRNGSKEGGGSTGEGAPLLEGGWFIKDRDCGVRLTCQAILEPMRLIDAVLREGKERNG